MCRLLKYKLTSVSNLGVTCAGLLGLPGVQGLYEWRTNKVSDGYPLMPTGEESHKSYMSGEQLKTVMDTPLCLLAKRAINPVYLPHARVMNTVQNYLVFLDCIHDSCMWNLGEPDLWTSSLTGINGVSITDFICVYFQIGKVPSFY